MLGPYLVSIFKVTNILRERVVKANDEFIENNRRIFHRDGCNWIASPDTQPTISIVGLGNGTEFLNPQNMPIHLPAAAAGPGPPLPPTYEEAMHTTSLHSTSSHESKPVYCDNELPPHYSDIVNCHNEI